MEEGHFCDREPQLCKKIRLKKGTHDPIRNEAIKDTEVENLDV